MSSMVTMYEEDEPFFDSFRDIDVYDMSSEQLEQFYWRAFSIFQPSMTGSQEPCVLKFDKVLKRLREMHHDELKQEISKLEKEKTNSQPLPRLKCLLKLFILKEQLEDAEQLLKYSQNPWWRK